MSLRFVLCFLIKKFENQRLSYENYGILCLEAGAVFMPVRPKGATHAGVRFL